MNITLRQLEVFCAIATRSNVSRAAEAVAISQSAASMALAELERQLGTRLFDRLGKKLVLNTNGQALFLKATDLMARAGELERLFDAEDSVGGDLKVGASSTIGNYLMPGLLGGFSETSPDVHVTLQVGNTEQIIHSLVEGDIDLGFIEGLCDDPHVESRHWRSDELIVVAGPEHPLATQRTLTWEDIAAADWILRERGSGTREIFERALSGKSGNLNIRYELGQTEAIKQAVKNRMGISCLSRLTVQEELKTGALIELAVPFLSLRRDLTLLQRKGKYLNGSMKSFIGYIDGTEKDRS